MSALQQLVSLLDRDGVDLVIIQEGIAPHIRRRDGLHPVSREKSTRENVEHLLYEAGLLSHLENALSSGVREVPFSLEGRPFSADILMKRDRLQIRFATRTAADATPKPPIPPPPTRERTAAPTTSSVRNTDARSTLEAILNKSRSMGASDVHLSSEYPAQVRRIGALTGMGKPISAENLRQMLFSLLDPNQQQRLDTSGYIDLAVQLPSAGRFRVNISRQRGGLKGCFRLVPEGPRPLEALRLPAELSKVAVHHQGLVVVSGPNGAGKTTTMASLVDLFNETRPIHIITVEDPVEICHAPKQAVISQREVGTHTRSFNTALKGALREDPDVIAIGELRDLETVEMALSAAETGHLVLATMSTPSGAVTIDRLIDMFPRGVQPQVRSTLAGTLKIIISQRLVPGKDGQTQYAAAELITGNIPLYAMIRDNKLFQLPSLQQQGRAYGMIRLEDSLNNLVKQERITLETARLYANDPGGIIDPAAENEAASAPVVDAKPASKFGMKQMAQKLRGK